MRKALCIITAGILVSTVLSGCSLTQKLGFGNKDELKAASSTALSEEENKKLAGKMPVNLYFGSSDNTKLMLEVRYIDENLGKKGTASLATAIVNELINGPTEKELKATIPQGTKQAGTVVVTSGTATVNFTKEFVDKHPGGGTAAKLTIYSVVNSLTELSDIQRVKFLVNGKAVTDFKGAYKFDAPFPRTVSLIGKSPSSTATDASAAAKSTATSKQQTTDKGKVTATPTPAPKTTATPKATIAPSSKPTTAQPAATVKPSATPKKSSSVLPQSSNINTFSSQLAYMGDID